MSERYDDNLNEQQRNAQDAVRGLPRPAADAEYRARLKARFLEGVIPEGDLSSAELATEDEGFHLGRIWLGWSGLAAAAVLAAVLLTFNRLPGPELADTSGVGTVTIDGRELAVTRAGTIGDALHVGARVQVGEGASLDVLYPGSFVMRLGAGTDIVLPSRPGRWFRRTVEAPMAWGEVSIRTGPDLAGGGLVVRTEEARAVIAGTLVSVVRNEMATCVCLIEGSAGIITDEADLGAIPPGMRWLLMRDGSEPQLLEIMPAHRDHMAGLDTDLGTIFD